MDRFDRKDLKDAVFDIVLRGYDKRQVDQRLRILDSELAAAAASLQAAQERVAMLEDELNQVRARSGSDSPADSNFGARIEKILVLAEEEARQVRGQADAAATALVAQAQAEAEQIRKAVAQEVDELFKAARADADEVCKAARAEAAQVVAQARTEANRLVAAATEAAQQRERASAHEVHQLSRLRDEINADLYRAKEILENLFGPTRLKAVTRLKDGPHERHQARTV